MPSGMTPFTLFHVALSLVGIATGFVVMKGMLQSQRLPGWTGVFLAATLATTATGFLFPIHGFTPALGVGVMSSAVLALTPVAPYERVSQYLNVFVLVVQVFDKVPGARMLAPTQKKPPFAIAQGVALLLFVAFGALAVRRFHPPA